MIADCILGCDQYVKSVDSEMLGEESSVMVIGTIVLPSIKVQLEQDGAMTLKVACCPSTDAKDTDVESGFEPKRTITCSAAGTFGSNVTFEVEIWCHVFPSGHVIHDSHVICSNSSNRVN